MPRRGQERFTVKLIPHSAGPVAEWNTNSRTIQACCVVLILVFLSLTVFAARYAQMVSYVHELRDLRLLTQLQDEQLRVLAESTTQLHTRLTELARLDTELRQMLRLEAPLPPVDKLLAANPSFTVAGAPASDAGSTYLPSTMAVETSLSAMAGYLSGSLDVLREEMEYRITSLDGLRVAAAEKLAYDAARPSIWPTQGRVTSRYGYRIAPFGGARQMHPAIDIGAPVGTPVVATGDGRVAFTGWRSDLGNTVMIDHGYGFETLYGHVSKPAVAVGDRVKKGQVIAYVGSTGRSTGPHLHYEVHVRGGHVNPALYLN
ncbi:MAG: M23 family metallopeptidase [Bacillota bacterium]|nr:M23 family metallopeptidase [Bacillota bacterium]